jgi:hypothetical protein
MKKFAVKSVFFSFFVGEIHEFPLRLHFFYLQYLQFLKELGSELRLHFLGDSSASPQNDREFRITDFMDYADCTDLRESFSTTLEMTILRSE